MNLKFEATISGYAVKENKDLGKVVVLALSTELTRPISEPAMMYGSKVTVGIDHFAWRAVLSTKAQQATIEQALSEECAICGHQKGFHKLDPNVCLGDDGMCPCSGFVSREQAAKEAVGDTAEVVDDYPPLPDELHCSCGHLRSHHNPENGCMVNLETLEVEEGEIGAHTCQCIRVFLEDGTPDGLVGDHDDVHCVCGHALSDHSSGACNGDMPDGGVCSCPQYVNAESMDEKRQLPLPNTPCLICGHELQFHDADMVCCIKLVDGMPVATCTCPGFEVSVDDGAPGYDYDLPDEEEIEEAEAAVEAEEPAGDICTKCGHLKVAHTAGFGCMAEDSEGRMCSCANGFFAAAVTYPVEGDGNALVGNKELAFSISDTELGNQEILIGEVGEGETVVITDTRKRGRRRNKAEEPDQAQVA